MTGRLEGPEGSLKYHSLFIFLRSFMPHTQNRVQIILQAAQFLFHEARVLIGMGAGEDEIGNDLGIPGEIDNIPMESETYRWASATIRFLKYLAQVLGPAITDYYQLEGAAELQALLDVTNQENNNNAN